ncbi:ATP-binding protein [Psychrobacter pulmonis]
MESQTVEYKSDIPKKVNDLKAEISAFLNTNDGTIFLGVDDDGMFIPESINNFKHWESLLSDWIQSAFNLPLNRLIKLDVSERCFAIYIKKGEQPPYYYKDGESFNSKGIYIRNGSSKRRATDDEVRRMIQAQVADKFEAQTAQTNQKLTFQYLQNKLLDNDTAFDEKSLRLLDLNEEYNNGALILSDQSPFVTKIAVVDGLDMNSDFLAKKEFSGSLVRQIDLTLEYISLLNDKKISFTGSAARLEYEAYPAKAIREAVINAYAHRDYSLSADTKIEIYDDRMEIFSAGNIPDGLSVEDIKTGTSARRNINLVHVLDKITYMENYGSGIRRILGSYKDAEKEPEFIVTANQFKVILHNRHYRLDEDTVEIVRNDKLKQSLTNAEQLELGFTLQQDSSLYATPVAKNSDFSLDTNDQKIIKLLMLNDEMSRKEVESYFDESKTKIYQRLKKLIEINIVETRGRSKSTVYFLNANERK